MAKNLNVQTLANLRDPMGIDPNPTTSQPPQVPPSARPGVTTPLAGFTIGTQETRTTNMHNGEIGSGTEGHQWESVE
uniref:Uncharacterized protein n=1 Tax=Cannabis sativa TaxID=3483 RepID=A0A803QGU5_CANSA